MEPMGRAYFVLFGRGYPSCHRAFFLEVCVGSSSAKKGIVGEGTWRIMGLSNQGFNM